MPAGLVLPAARALIRLLSAAAPGWRRDDLRREWLAELQGHAAALASRGALTRAARLRLLLRCAGLAPHVLWAWRHEWSLDMLMQDVRYGLRMLRRRPLFSIVAIGTLALGIGATTAIFSAVRGIVLRPLPHPDPDRLVRVFGYDARGEGRLGNLSMPDVVDYARLPTTTVEFGAHNSGGSFTLSGPGGAERIPRLLVTSGYFRVLGARAALGRLFASDEDRPSPPDVVVVSNDFWRTRLDGDANAIGRAITLDGRPRTIIGVLPRGFVHPDPDIDAPPDVFALLNPDPAVSGRGGRFVRGIARLRDGVALEEAQGELQTIAASLAAAYPNTNQGRSVVLRPLARVVAGDLRRPLLLLQAATVAILLIVCANLANLLLAAGAGRAGELAMRTALGATRLRLVRQLLTEGLVLAAAGGLLGAALAWVAASLLAQAPALSPLHQAAIVIDGRVLGFAVLVSMGSAFLFALVPALHVARGAGHASSRAASRLTGDRAAGRFRFALIAAEVGLSVMLVLAAALLVRSFWHLTGVNPGFDAPRVLSFEIAAPSARYPEGTQARFYERLYERLRRLPGVESIGAVNILPLSGSYSCDGVQIVGRIVPEGEEACAEARSASPGYFETMGIPLVRGRLLAPGDDEDAPRVVVIDETMARTFFPGEDPIGRRILYSSRRQEDAREIVGIVGDVRHFGPQRQAPPEFYMPQAQPPSYHAMTVVLRVQGSPESLVPAIRAGARALEPEAPVYNVRTIEDLMGRSTGEERLRTWLLGLMAGLALLLALVGTYGVLSVAVAQRTREIGVRLALGADRSDVLRLVVWQGLRPVALGLAAGLAGSLALSGTLEGLLFEIDAADPLTFAIVPALIAASSVLAAWLPARRACRVDPASVLRLE